MSAQQHYRYELHSLTVLDSPMEVLVFRPEGAGPHPGLLLCQHLPMGHTGLENDPFTLTSARRLADAGFVVVAPFIFHWWPKSAPVELKRENSRDDWTVADLRAAFALLRNDASVDAARLGVVGHCWGGRVAWLAAGHLPDLQVLATFYGGNIGKGLGAGNPPPLGLTRFMEVRRVIGFYGNDDTNPSPGDVAAYAKALDEAGIAYEFHRYDGAGHAFQNFPMPERYREAASEDAWSKLLEFLRRELQGS
ncbi:MAG: dienelactone hydrolase family protein [Pseudomonadales bacterium]|jgi:carboxymethylenebutenolidase|nr:dienelactone hydrolase family protein [Pseudomonadales bacterium]